MFPDDMSPIEPPEDSAETHLLTADSAPMIVPVSLLNTNPFLDMAFNTTDAEEEPSEQSWYV